jgi:hypothetical protein
VTTGEDPANLAAGDWPDDEVLASPVDGPTRAPASTALPRPGVSPTVRWVAVGAALAGVAVMFRLLRRVLGGG